MTLPAFILLLAALPANAQTRPAETIDGRAIIVIDGDTVALPAGPGRSERLRLHAIDAPESYRARCEAELVAGLKAKARLRALLSGPVRVTRGEPGTGRQVDRYGRTLGALETPAGDAAGILIAEGLAIRWHPGARSETARRWCEGKR